MKKLLPWVAAGGTPAASLRVLRKSKFQLIDASDGEAIAPRWFALNRDNAHRHMAFASGIHYCLGSALAKLETEIAIGSLFTRFKNISIESEPTWRDRITIRGVNQLKLTFS